MIYNKVYAYLANKSYSNFRKQNAKIIIIARRFTDVKTTMKKTLKKVTI